MLIYFENVWWAWGGGGRGVNKDGRLYLRGGLSNLAKMVVSILNKELEYKVEKLEYKKLEVMRPRIKNKSKLPTRDHE